MNAAFVSVEEEWVRGWPDNGGDCVRESVKLLRGRKGLRKLKGYGEAVSEDDIGLTVSRPKAFRYCIENGQDFAGYDRVKVFLKEELIRPQRDAEIDDERRGLLQHFMVHRVVPQRVASTVCPSLHSDELRTTAVIGCFALTVELPGPGTEAEGLPRADEEIMVLPNGD